MINNFFRVILKNGLAILSRMAINKHKPIIIAVLGNNYASFAKEAIYAITSLRYNTRRNLENPDSEFSIPLTILGELSYPHTYTQWIHVIIKNTLRTAYLKPYNHLLVIQIKNITNPIHDYWLTRIRPQFIIDTSNWTKENIEELLEGKIPDEFIPILNALDIDIATSEEILKSNFFPTSRISIIPAKKDSYIIDARHYYFPPKVKTIVEIADSLGASKYLITSLKDDSKRFPDDYKDIEYIDEIDKFPSNSVFIFRGSKNEFSNEIRELSVNDLEI